MVLTAVTMEEKALKAMQMRDNGSTLEDIAEALGYSDASGVSKLIKRFEEVRQGEDNLTRLESDLTKMRQTNFQLESKLSQLESDLTKLRQTNFQLESKLTEFESMQDKLSQREVQIKGLQERVEIFKTREKSRQQNRFVLFFKGDAFMTFIVLIGGISLACAITAPIFMHVGVAEPFAYILGLYVDIAAFIFVLRNRHKLGVIFSLATALQAAIKLGAFDWMLPTHLIVLKATVLAVALGIATYGFSDLIASSQKHKIKENGSREG